MQSPLPCKNSLYLGKEPVQLILQGILDKHLNELDQKVEHWDPVME